MNTVIESFQALFAFPLDPFQIEAAEAILNRKSVLVTAPTGSGKTVIAEFTIFDALDRGLKVIYTTPLKALSNQKFRDFSEQYGSSNVGLVTGDVSINQDAKIVVMTTEILRNILYQDIRRIDEVLYIILDECHYMNDKDRGTVWEEVIIHTPKHILFVALSATVANSGEMASWMSSIHNKTDLIEHPFRSVPLEHYYFSKGTLTKILNNDGTVSSKLLKEEEKDEFRTQRNKINPISVITRLHDKNLLPAIYFVFSRKGCDMNLVDCLNSRLKLVTDEERAEISEVVNKVMLENPTLAETSPVTKKLLRALPEGIAVHHAGLVPVARFLVENLFQKGLIKVIFATETLAAGINMPARTTIISSLSKRGDNGHEVLSANSFTQMTGRAGRRGKDKVGYCVIINDGKEPYTEAIRLVKSPPDPIRSNFTLSYNMVLNLLKIFNYEDVKFSLQKSFGQYLANKEIINLELSLEKKQADVQDSFVPCKYKPELTIKNMPLLSYENILNEIADQEYRISEIQKEYDLRYYQRMRDLLIGARKGSILLIKTKNSSMPILGCLVFTYRERNSNKGGGDFFAVVQTDKGVTRITPMECLHIYKDNKNIFLPDDIYADSYNIKVGAWLTDERLKKLFDKNEQKRYVRHIPTSSRYNSILNEELEVLYSLRKKLSKHECSSCDILNSHLGQHLEFSQLANQIANIKETISIREKMYLEDFDRLVRVLQHFNNVELNNENQIKPNEIGLLTSYIRAENELAICLMIIKGILDDLNPVQIAAVLSTLIFEPRRESYSDFDYLPRKIKNKIKDLSLIINELNSVQQSYGIDKDVVIEVDFIEVVLKWGGGESWKSLFENNSLDDGDVIRSFRRIIDILHQLKNIPYINKNTKEKIFQAISALDRDIISVNYEVETVADAELVDSETLIETEEDLEEAQVQE